MFCSNCGKKLEDGAKFCPECGEVFARDAVNNAAQEGAEAVEAAGSELGEAAQNAAAAVDDSATVYAGDIDNNVNAAAASIDNQAEEAEREARRIEEEAAAQIARAKAKAEEARAKAEAVKAAQMEKAREEMRQKARIDATEAVNLANYKISQAAQVTETQKKAEAEAMLAHQKAQEVIKNAQELGVAGIPALAALPEAHAFQQFADVPKIEQPEEAGDGVETAVVETAPVKYVRPIGYILWQLLYCVPVIGWIFLIVHTFSKKNRNLKYYAISFWIRLVIVLLIAAIGLLLFVIFRESVFVSNLEITAKNIWDALVSAFTAFE